MSSIATAATGLSVSAPHAKTVSGSIVFAARGVKPTARQVVFAVDGHHTWTTHARPYRFHQTGRLDTRSLSDGRHVLSVKAVYPRRQVRIARMRINVRNHNSTVPHVAATVLAPPPAIAQPPVLGVTGPPASGVFGPSPTLFNRVTYSYSTTLPVAQEAGRYQVMLMQSTDGAKVAALHAANPNLRIFVYQDIMFSKPTDPNGGTTCTPYSSNNASNPSWFLTDQSGNRILDRSYANDYMMDVGNPAYQQACVAHATAVAKQYGFDGVYFDDVNAAASWSVSAGVSIPQYSTVSAWQSAMTAMVSYAGPSLHAQGLLVLGNIGGSTLTPGLWQRWTAPLDGSEEESWTDGGSGLAQQSPLWSKTLANAAWSEANGKLAILHSHNTTETGNTFGLATMLLVAAGHSSYSTSNGNYQAYEAWYPEYDTAQALGAPAGPYTQLSNGVYERVFAHGIVLVNPSSVATASFSLGGQQYSGSGLSHAGTTAIAPTSALILTLG